MLIRLPLNSHPLKTKYLGPFAIARKVDNVNYIVNTPSRRKKTQKCHVNMIKPYFRHSQDRPILAVKAKAWYPAKELYSEKETLPKLKNSEILPNQDTKLIHLPQNERSNIGTLIFEHEELFSDVPDRQM